MNWFYNLETKIMLLNLEDFKARFILNFIKKNRWQYITRGLRLTVEITIFALILGLILGSLAAVIRSSYDLTHTKKCSGLSQKIYQFILSVLNIICKIYLTVIRGTPSVVQLLIIYFVIFGDVAVDKVFVAVVAFGINSGAYVAEIIRSGIMSVDKGQFEAGRSLGFGYFSTMRYIILPQAVKNILPALGNEFIVLLKETSISGYIALEDLTKGADIIRSRTYDAFMPLIAIALIYLAMVMLLSWAVGILERRLRRDER